MDPDQMAQRFGFEKDDDDETKKKKEEAFWAGHEAMKARCSAMDAAAANEDDSKKEMSAVDEGLKALATTFNLDPSLPRKVLLTSLRNVAKPGADESAIVARVRAELKAEQDAAAAHKLGTEITERAVKFGMAFATDAERTEFVAFAAKSPAAAESVVKALPGAKLMGRITAGGAPVGARETAPAEPTTAGNVRIMGQSLSAAAKKLLAEGKASDIGTAQIMAIRANPNLGAE